MALQTSGQISLGNIATEFGGSAPHQLSEYYDTASGIPASGEISIGDFYGAQSYPTWNYYAHSQSFSTYNTSGSWTQSSDRIYLSGASYNGGMRGGAVAASAFYALQSPWTLDYTANRNGVNSSPYPNYGCGLTRSTSASSVLNDPSYNGLCYSYIGNAYGCYAYVKNASGSTVANINMGSTYAYAGAKHRFVFDPSTFNIKLYGMGTSASTYTLIGEYTFTASEKSAWLSSYQNSTFRVAVNARSNSDGWRDITWYTN